MTGKERLITALDGGCPDHLPVTTHHIMEYFKDTYMGGCQPKRSKAQDRK